MSLTSPMDIIRAKLPFAASGNRINAIFLTWMVSDGETVRKLVHDNHPATVPVLSAFYDYYISRDYGQMINRMRDIIVQFGGAGGFRVETHNGQSKLYDSGIWGVSRWGDLATYDKRHTMSITDGGVPGRPNVRRFDNASVADVLYETLNNLTYRIQVVPTTGNATLDLHIGALYNAKYGPTSDANPHISRTTYGRALQIINADLIAAFSGIRVIDNSYIPAIVILDKMSGDVFRDIGYPEQFGFYRSELGTQILKFSYLTTMPLKKFDFVDMDSYLTDIRTSNNWQMAQYKITQRLAGHRLYGGIVNRHLMGLNTIRPRPAQRMYHPYYDADIVRTGYMNLYLGR